MAKKKKPKIEFRYYKMPENRQIIALLGEKWVQSYGLDIDYLHFHNYLEIGYCYNGTGTLTLGQQDYRFTGNQFSIIPKNYPHTTTSDPGTVSKWEYLFVDVEGLLKETLRTERTDSQIQWLCDRINSQAIFQSAAEAPGVAAIIRGVMDNIRGRKPFYMEEAKGLMLTLFAIIARSQNVDKAPLELNSKILSSVSLALDYISEHYMEQIKIKDIANFCHISETHFRRIFSTHMNISPLEYLNLIRIHAACDFLRKTDYSIADIANKCGFITPSTFNRNFQQVTGTSPAEWRKQPENFEQQLLQFNLHFEQGW